MRFSRHAKNRMRWAKLDREAIESVVVAPEVQAVDPDGNRIVIARDSEDRLVKVVIALDDPGFVITVITEEQ